MKIPDLPKSFEMLRIVINSGATVTTLFLGTFRMLEYSVLKSD